VSVIILLTMPVLLYVHRDGDASAAHLVSGV
jgi:hypothetical protein